MEQENSYIDNLINDHEENFLKDTTDNGRFIMSIGQKGGGKSYLLCAYLKCVLHYNIFKYIHFVCPCYNGEQNNSYAFLKDQKHVMIYPHYKEAVSKRVDTDRKKGKTLFIIDDGSGELLKNIDNTFCQLATTGRHFHGLTTFICVHSCKKILTPLIRQNIDHLFIYRIINMKLLNDLYDEYFSSYFDRFKDFKAFYMDIIKEKYSCIHFSIHQEGLDINVKNWSIITNQDQYVLKKTKSNVKKPVKKKEEDKPKQQGINLDIVSMFKKGRK